MKREGNLPARKARALAALVTSRTVGEAARRAGVGRRTVSRWKRSDERFRAEMEDARKAITRAAVAEATARLGVALAVLQRLAEDEDAPPGVRADAAQALLRLALGQREAEA